MIRTIRLLTQRGRTVTIIVVMVMGSFAGSAFAEDFDYTHYASLLRNYVHEGKQIKGFTLNVVDYAGLFTESKNPASDYSRVLRQLSAFDPETLSSREEKVAFWINAYNIGAMKMILDHYPTDSIRSRKINFWKNPWGIKILSINGSEYSLGQIEHEILLMQYKALLAHFAIVCASLSCPEITKDVYSAGTLETQLIGQAKSFMNDPTKGYSIDRKGKTIHVSRIFKFDSKNFGKGATVIVPFILPFIENSRDREYLEKETYDLEFLDYDWDLNSLKSVK